MSGGALWIRRPRRRADSPRRPRERRQRRDDDVVDHRRPVQAATNVQMASGWELVIANRHQALS